MALSWLRPSANIERQPRGSGMKLIRLKLVGGRGRSHMRELSNDERNLLRHYSERDRVIDTRNRTPAHQHLLGIGYIKEHAVNIQELLISATEAGRQALRSPP